MQFDSFDLVAQAAKEQAALPPAPPPKPERSAWGAIGRGIAGGVAKVAGQLQEFSAGLDERYAAEQDQLRGPGSRQAASARQIGGALQERASMALDYERGLRPDAATATTAENVVYGVSNSLTRAIGAVATLGPVAGAAAFGTSEAAGTFDDLRREGVDPTTAGKAAAVAGVAGGVGVVLPMMGSTLARTAALYAAGGPGGFMAQQAATRAILERANYDELAKKYDPLDPVGLSLSALIPLPFAAMGAARNIRGAVQDVPGQAPRADQAGGNAEVPPVQPGVPEAPMTSEAIDAAMVHNLTLSRAQAEAVPPMAGAAEMFRGPVTENPNFKAWFGESKAVGEDGQPLILYHGTRADFGGFSTEASGGLFHFTTQPDVAENYAVGGGGFRAREQSFYVHADTGEVFTPSGASGYEVEGWSGNRGTFYTTRQLRDRLDFGDVREVKEGSSILPVYLSVRPLDLRTKEGRAVLAALDHQGNAVAQRIITEAGRGNFNWIDTKYEPTQRVWQRVLAPQLEERGYTGIQFKDDGLDPYTIAVFRPEQIKSAVGNSGRFDPNSGSLTDPIPEAPVAQAVQPEPVKAPEQVDQARQALADLQDSGKPIEQFAAERTDLAPDVRNLLIGLYEAGADGARADRMLADYARTVTAQRLRPTVDVAADVVDAARAGKTVTPEPAAAAQAATPETAAAQMTAERITTLETQNPDMVVRIEDDGRQVTLAEELQRIRQEATEGSDVELGALDAELVKVAAECAISTGAV